MKLTILTSSNALNKIYNKVNGEIVKSSPVIPAVMAAETVQFNNLRYLSEILKKVSNNSNQVVMFDHLNADLTHYNITSDTEMRRCFGDDYNKSKPHQDSMGNWYASRNASAFLPANIICLDKDSCIGFEGQTVDQFMAAVRGVSDGVMDNVGYLVVESNSARVGMQSNNAHIYIESNGGNKAAFLRALSDRLTLAGYYHQPSDKTPLDKSVGAPVRMFFEGCPISMSGEVVIKEASIRLVDGGIVQADTLKPVSSADIAAVTGRTRSRTGKVIYGVLTDDTPIELQKIGIVRWDDDIIQKGFAGSKLRCQIPDCVRTESRSWNGVIHGMAGGGKQLYDNGDDQRYAVEPWKQPTMEEMGFTVGMKPWKQLTMEEMGFTLNMVEPVFWDGTVEPVPVFWDGTVGDTVDEPVGAEPVIATDFKAGLVGVENDQVFTRLIDELKSVLKINAPQLIEADVFDIANIKQAWDRVYICNNKFTVLNDQYATPSYILSDAVNFTKAAGLRFNVKGMGEGEGKDGEKVKQEMRKHLISVFCSYVKEFRQRDILVNKTDLFAYETSMEINNFNEIIFNRRFDNFDNVPSYETKHTPFVDDFNEHTKGFFNDLLDFITDARVSHNRRAANMIFEATSSFGKSMLIESVLGAKGLGLIAKVSVNELKHALSGAPSGLSPDVFSRAWAIVIDESRFVPAEIKEMDDSFEFSPKMKGKVRVEVFSKLFVSANPMDEVSSGATDRQFINRFSYVKLDGVIDDRPLFKQHGYVSALIAYAAYRIGNRLSKYRELGEEKAGQLGYKRINEFHNGKGLIEVAGDLFETVVAPLIEELRAAIAMARPIDHQMAFGNEKRLHVGKCIFKGSTDFQADEAIGQCLIPDKNDKYIIATSRAKVLNLWLKAKLDDDQYKSVRRLKGQYTAVFGRVSSAKDKDNVKRDGVLIDML